MNGQEVALSSFCHERIYPELLDVAEEMLAAGLCHRWPAVTEVTTTRRWDGPFSWEDEDGVRHTRPGGWAVFATGINP